MSDERLAARRARRRDRLTANPADRRPASRAVGDPGRRLTPVTVDIYPPDSGTTFRFVDDRGNEYTGPVPAGSKARQLIDLGCRRAVLSGRVVAHEPLVGRGHVTTLTHVNLVAS